MLHNPDNLTDEQTGAADGWRLLNDDEIVNQYNLSDESPILERWWFAGDSPSWSHGYLGTSNAHTYRTKLTPAELRKARGLEPLNPPLSQAVTWIPISERLPGVDHRVLVETAAGWTSVGFLNESGQWIFSPHPSIKEPFASPVLYWLTAIKSTSKLTHY